MELKTRNVDPNTGLIVYGTLGKLGTTDPEVDSIYLTCYYYYFKHLLADGISKRYLDFKFSSLVKQFKVSDGIFRRYPLPGQNKEHSLPQAKFDDPRNLSRDNTLPLVIGFGHFGHRVDLKHFMIAMLKRFSFYQNTHTHKGESKLMPDFAPPDNWATFVRAYVESYKGLGRLNKICLWLLLNLLDVFSVLQTLLYVLHGHFINPNETGSELNIFAACLQRKLVLQTPLGYIANLIYFKMRAFPVEVAYNGRYSDKAWIAAVENFFGRGRRFKIMPELDALVRELDKKYKF